MPHLWIDKHKVLDVNHADDVVHARFVHQNAREAALEDVVNGLLIQRRGDVLVQATDS